ncbi:MAG: carboxypeptidase-like regulatory domain-containing protein, partial [Dysgonamonadaceae bacterium]|nr:carboxypeptidase-like regulatory domain-containing protein [Dysgonamonadaceae bacterium]
MRQLSCRSAILLLCFFGLFATTKAQTQKITLPQKQMTILSVFEEIEKQTRLTIAYNEANLNVNRIISVDVKDKQLTEALQIVLKGTNATFKIQGKQIIIVAENPAPTTDRYMGVVVDENGEALPGATIQLKKGATGTISDANGNFALDVPKGSVISVSFLGYLTREVVLGENRALRIALQEDNR